nr:unnamed protein product [Callosobruchus chinensis]CAH7754540.1 unnamed protein product [Callosobruchus chinensis]
MSAFTFCWLPFFVLALMRPFLENTHALKTLATLFLWLGYANSLLNPIIYATLNRDFRKPFQVSTPKSSSYCCIISVTAAPILSSMMWNHSS